MQFGPLFLGASVEHYRGLERFVVFNILIQFTWANSVNADKKGSISCYNTLIIIFCRYFSFCLTSIALGFFMLLSLKILRCNPNLAGSVVIRRPTIERFTFLGTTLIMFYEGKYCTLDYLLKTTLVMTCRRYVNLHAKVKHEGRTYKQIYRFVVRLFSHCYQE